MAIAWRNERRLLMAADVADEAGGEVVDAEDDLETVDDTEPADAGSSRGLLLGTVAVIAVALVGAVVAFAMLGGGDDSASPTATETQTTIPVAGDPVNGKLVFASTGCAGCHAFAPAGASGKTGPSLDTTALTEAQIAAVIAGGRGAMTAYAGDLSPQEIADLAAFVHAGGS